MSDPENPIQPELQPDAMPVGPEPGLSPDLSHLADTQSIRLRIQQLQGQRMTLLESIQPGQDIPPEVRSALDAINRETLELNSRHFQIDGTSGMKPD